MAVPDVKCLPGPSNTCTYVVSCPNTKKAALIDTAVNYESGSCTLSYEHAHSVMQYCKDQKLTVEQILETHVHADHLTAAQYIRDQLSDSGVKVAIGTNITTVQKTFTALYNLEEKEVAVDGSQFDTLYKEGDTFKIGDLECRVLATPGHTPACISYVIGDAVFVGDTFFMPDCGTARCDFPGGSAEDLWDSLNKLLALPPKTRMFVGHDYPNGKGREFAWETSIPEQKAKNVYMKDPVTKEGFIKARKERDAKLSAPGILHQSLQVNIRAGALPSAENNGRSYLKLPLSVLGMPSGHD